MRNLKKSNSENKHKDNSKNRFKKHLVNIIITIIVGIIVFAIMMVDFTNGIVAVTWYVFTALIGGVAFCILEIVEVRSVAKSKRGKERLILVASMITLSLVSSIVISMILSDTGYETSFIYYARYVFICCFWSVNVAIIINDLKSHSKNESKFTEILLIIPLATIVLLNYKSSLDFPRFISGNSIKYVGYCSLDTEKKLQYTRDGGSRTKSFSYWYKKSLALDTGERLSFGNGTNAKLAGNGAYKITYLPNSKHILSLAKISDKTLEKTKANIDLIAETVNTSPLIINTIKTYNNVDYTAKCAIRITKVITKSKIMDFDKVIPMPEGILTKDMIALKITMNYDNFKPTVDNPIFIDFASYSDILLTENTKDISAGQLMDDFTGGFTRSVDSLYDTKINPGSKITVEGWVIVDKSTYGKSNSLFLQFSSLNEEKPGIKEYIDITKYLK